MGLFLSCRHNGGNPYTSTKIVTRLTITKKMITSHQSSPATCFGQTGDVRLGDVICFGPIPEDAKGRPSPLSDTCPWNDSHCSLAPGSRKPSERERTPRTLVLVDLKRIYEGS